jgi:hypothetical protein
VNNTLSAVVPAKAGTHTPQRCGAADENNIAWWFWVPACAGTTTESQS